MRIKYNVETQLVFQIGDPMDHSCAAYLHSYMYELANLNALCVQVTIPKGRLPEFIASVRLLNANGFGITMPHKSDIVDYLDECDEMSRLFRCVNHVKLVDGKLIGVGLDGLGMALSIEDRTGPVKGRNVLVIGSGAVAGPVAVNLVQRGAAGVTFVNRTIEKAQQVAGKLQAFTGIKAQARPLDSAFLEAIAPEHDLVVQCTSLGMAGSGADFESFAFVDRLPAQAVVADALYPTTRLLETARARGLATVNGVGMMVQQQIAATEFRFGVRLPASVLPAAEEALAVAIAMRQCRYDRRARAAAQAPAQTAAQAETQGGQQDA